MGLELVASVLTAVVSLLAGGLTSTEFIQKVIRKVLNLPEPAPRPYSERLTALTSSLRRASQEVDAVLAGLSQVATDRANAVRALEEGVTTLETREKELKARIEALEQTPLAVADHFAKLVEPGEARSARRDYLLFGAGVVVSTALGIVVQLFVR